MATPSNNNSLNNVDYLSFDALSMKELLIKNLNEGSYFKDQNIAGSNWNTLIDQISVTFGMLMFYLNKTQSETSFTQQQLFDAMSNIVSILNYKPIGYQTQSLQIKCTNSTTNGLQNGIYTLPRYSFIYQKEIPYSFTKDITFQIDDTESYITSLSDNNFLLQGKFEEYHEQEAIGEDFEVIYLVNKNEKNNVFVDYFNIHVYVKPYQSDTWEEWNRSDSLYTKSQTSPQYEVTYNQKENYEIKFGNGVYGKKLNAGDKIKIFYLRSNMSAGEVDKASLNNSKMKIYRSDSFIDITTDVQDTSAWITDTDIQKIIFTNDFESTTQTEPETVQDIRQNAPKLTKYKNFTVPYIESFIETKFKNIISSAKVVSNKTFISGHLKYLNDLGRNFDSKFIQSLILFSSNAQFNNIYVYMSPKFQPLKSNGAPNFVNYAQKKYIQNGLEEIRIPTAEMILMDPVFYIYDFGIQEIKNEDVNDILNETKIVIIADKVLRRNLESIKQDFTQILNDFFSFESNKLGQTIDYQQLSLALNNISGVSRIYTVRNGKQFNGISLLGRSIQYPQEDYTIYVQEHSLDYFKFPLFDQNSLTNRLFADYNEDSQYLK